MYHDTEWGKEVRDDVALFERLSLEAFQSGLSWLTVLRKRDAFRQHFHHFNPERVAAMGEREIASLLQEPSIIRHRGKIEACINNSQALMSMWEIHGTTWLAETLTSSAPSETALKAQGFVRPPVRLDQLPAKTTETVALAKLLKGSGFKFLGPTTLYAGLQATGFVHDHVLGCHLFGSQRF